jgi:hypothetical protein
MVEKTTRRLFCFRSTTTNTVPVLVEVKGTGGTEGFVIEV